MSAALKAKFQAANDGPPMAPSMRTIKTSARVVPLITLRQPKKKLASRIILSCAVVFALASGAAAFWYAENVLDILKPPEPLASKPDPEQELSYADTVVPPPGDVVAPLPVLPEPLASLAVASDPNAGIALPASSLQAPYPAGPEIAKPDPAIAVIVDKIKDLSATAPAHAEGSQVSVQKEPAPATGNLLDKAQAKLDADDYEGALAIYDRLLASDRDNRVALAGKAEALKNTSHYEAAAAAYHQLLALNPKDETMRVNLASMLGSWGSPQASNELKHMVASRPGFAPAQAALAQALVGQGDALNALPHAWRAVQIEPDNALYRLDLAIAYDCLGHSSEAVGFYREVLKNYNAADARTAAMPISPPEIRQRVEYLEALMESAGKLASTQ